MADILPSGRPAGTQFWPRAAACAGGNFTAVKPAWRAWTAALGAWLVVSGQLPAQADAPEAGTARDVIIQADRAYNEKRYPDAVAGYEGFLRDFGSSPEAAPDLPLSEQ